MAEEEDDARFFSPTGCRKTGDGEEIIKLTVTKMPMEWGPGLRTRQCCVMSESLSCRANFSSIQPY